MWTALQTAHLYISTQHKLPGLQTQRKKCELWQDQPFFHFWLPQQPESTRQIVWLGLGWSSVRERSESSDTMLSDVVAPCSRALIASSKVRPFVWYTWKHGQAQRNLLHGAQWYLVFMPLGFLWHSAQMRCFRAPAFIGTISSLNRCSGCTTKILRVGLLNARSRFPSATRANTMVDLNSA